MSCAVGPVATQTAAAPRSAKQHPSGWQQRRSQTCQARQLARRLAGQQQALRCGPPPAAAAIGGGGSSSSSSSSTDDEYDVVVVGSGIGGLCCAGLLAKYGLKVGPHRCPGVGFRSLLSQVVHRLAHDLACCMPLTVLFIISPAAMLSSLPGASVRVARRGRRRGARVDGAAARRRRGAVPL